MQFKYLIDENQSIISDLDDQHVFDVLHPLVRSETRTADLIQEAKAITVKPRDIPIISRVEITDDDFDYHCVELGLNINIPTGRLNLLRYYVELLQDDVKQAAIIIDGFPKDKLIEKEKFKGKVYVEVSVSDLMKLVPHTVGEVLSNLFTLNVKLDPIDIGWMTNVLEIGFSGPYSSTADWWINGREVNIQDFACRFILRRDKNSQKVTARVYLLYVYDPSWFRRAYGVRTETIEYPLYPRPGNYTTITS